MYFRHLRDCWAWAEAELNPISEERGAVGEALYNPEVFPHERSVFSFFFVGGFLEWSRPKRVQQLAREMMIK